MQHLFVFFVLTLFSFKAFSTDDRNGVWFGTFGKKSISDKLSLWSEVQLRHNSELGVMAQTLFRGGLLYSPFKNHEFGLIMGYIETNLPNQTEEYRPTFQYIYQGLTLSSVNLLLRSRLELREIEENDDESLRYRLMLRTSTAINSNLDLVVWDEPFINLTKEQWTGNRAFDRNRLFVGLRKKFQNFSIETGYLNQFIPRDSDISEHLFVFYVNY